MTEAVRPIDMLVLPFTPDLRRALEGDPALKETLVRIFPVWDNSFTGENLLADMDAAGVERIVMPAFCTDDRALAAATYGVVQGLMQLAPDRIHGIIGIDPRDIVGSVRKIRRAIEVDGFVGAHSYPHWFGLLPDDRAYYAMYATCVELDVPIQIQVGQAWQTTLRGVGRPEAIDSLAVDFPDLCVICDHIGYPWEREMISVAMKHPNVYIGADTHHPRTWAPELIDYINGPGTSKVIWGTNKPVLEFSEMLEAVRALPIAPEALPALTRHNVERVYRFT